MQVEDKLKTHTRLFTIALIFLENGLRTDCDLLYIFVEFFSKSAAE